MGASTVEYFTTLQILSPVGRGQASLAFRAKQLYEYNDMTIEY